MTPLKLKSSLLLALALSACRVVEGSGGHLEVSWVGTDTGRISGSALAEWCEEQRRLEIRAIAGDTGVALAVFPDVVLSPDSYRVVTPVGKDTAAPSARVALRWFGKTAIKGFRGDSGAVVLESTDSGQLSGHLATRASSVSNSDRVTLTGEFENLTVVPQSRGCASDSEADSEAEDA
ncbi:MAG TPA: hypothetical protein VFU40_03645, partial [Gemmatimonadales bacterium]|nr:hypothetical protein [Gemmatimonadales bacterium]